MAEREKYYIGLNGQIFEVSKELYETYYKGQRKEKYFTHDLKQEHTKVDKVLSFKLDAPSPCRLDAPDLDLICYASADCLHQHLQVI